MGVRRYHDLIAWQLAERLSQEVHVIVLQSAGARADLKYRVQILDAARNIPSDIAEGFLRCSPGDFARFLDYALGSLAEVERRLHAGVLANYFGAKRCDEAFRLGRRSLTAMVRLKQSQMKRRLELRHRGKKSPRA